MIQDLPLLAVAIWLRIPFGKAVVARRMQTAFIYHYAFTMILGVFAILTWFWLQLARS